MWRTITGSTSQKRSIKGISCFLDASPHHFLLTLEIIWGFSLFSSSLAFFIWSSVLLSEHLNTHYSALFKRESNVIQQNWWIRFCFVLLFFLFFCTWDYLRLALRSVGGDWPCRWRPRCAQVRGLEVWHGRLLVDFLQSVSVDSKREGFWRQLKVWQNT